MKDTSRCRYKARRDAADNGRTGAIPPQGVPVFDPAIPPPLHAATARPLRRRYPVLIAMDLAHQCTGDKCFCDVPAPKCQRGGCSHDAGFARVWLSTSEVGKFLLTSLRHGVYYCASHAEEASDESGVPIVRDARVLAAYQEQAITHALGNPADPSIDDCDS